MRLLNLTTIDDWEKWQFHYYEKLIYHSKVPVINDETPLQQRTNKTTSSEKCALYMVMMTLSCRTNCTSRRIVLEPPHVARVFFS
mmetsp:Transcript_2899/g.4530  ORF Transcript_2899/g.4530 Transcript_2899/m.4530 type:complete len:85 (+) Transcript_2899:1438-1692(+)